MIIKLSLIPLRRHTAVSNRLKSYIEISILDKYIHIIPTSKYCLVYRIEILYKSNLLLYKTLYIWKKS